MDRVSTPSYLWTACLFIFQWEQNKMRLYVKLFLQIEITSDPPFEYIKKKNPEKVHINIKTS